MAGSMVSMSRVGTGAVEVHLVRRPDVSPEGETSGS